MAKMASDEDLEKQAQEMAEKALPASLPAAARKAKLPAVKQKIFERLKAQRDEKGSKPATSTPAVAQSPAGPATPISTAAPAAVSGASQPAPPTGPPPPPPPPLDEGPGWLRVSGMELVGDEPWFAELRVRRRLRDSVADAHKEQKILVGAPADEVVRICPEDGRVLGAGAVLRLGGAHLGGYGESDIAYAYRQLSRALHPDKNPDLPQAQAAFHRLSEAAEELRQGLNEQRGALQMLVGAMGGQATPQMLERPQEALFAEACRMLSAICGLVGEGEVGYAAQQRASAAFTRSSLYYTCKIPTLLADWFERPKLIDLFATVPVRTAYDCAPKRYRAQFICLLNRAALAEAKRFHDCVRGSWSSIIQTFPELALWRELRQAIQHRVWDSSAEPDPVPVQVAPPKQPEPKAKSRSRSKRKRSRSRRRSRDDDSDEDEADDGRRHKDVSNWRERRAEKDARRYDKERQRDIAWESRWSTSDDPNSPSAHETKEPERPPDPPKRDVKEAVALHPIMGWRACRWARKWRIAMMSILPSVLDASAASFTDPEVRRLGGALWREIVAWCRGNDTERALGLFRADHQSAKTFGWDTKVDEATTRAATRGLEPGFPVGEWAFVPLNDLLLVVGEGIVGMTAEGLFVDKPAGLKKFTFAQCFKKPGEKKAEPKPEEGDNGADRGPLKRSRA